MLRARRPEDVLNPALAAVGTPYDTAAAAERATQVQRALMQLTTDARAVIVLRHFGDLSYDEIAETLGVPSKTVKSRLHSARQKLGEQLSAGGRGRDRPPRGPVAGATRRRADLDQRAELDRLLAGDAIARQRAGELDALAARSTCWVRWIRRPASCARDGTHLSRRSATGTASAASAAACSNRRWRLLEACDAVEGALGSCGGGGGRAGGIRREGLPASLAALRAPLAQPSDIRPGRLRRPTSSWAIRPRRSSCKATCSTS